ncbi:MAG: hypothetical protein HOV81_19545 [Kofleriaceae bacterium]|nr:hypothetical protein [Kofleriaceae bacterium]
MIAHLTSTAQTRRHRGGPSSQRPVRRITAEIKELVTATSIFSHATHERRPEAFESGAEIEVVASQRELAQADEEIRVEHFVRARRA